MADNVFVVQRETDGMWEADCCDRRCGGGLHNITEADNEADAKRGAAAHRRELAAMEQPIYGVPAAVCPTCRQKTPMRSA